MGASFSILAGSPYGVDSQSTFRFGNGWLLISGLGPILAVATIGVCLEAVLSGMACGQKQSSKGADKMRTLR